MSGTLDFLEVATRQTIAKIMALAEQLYDANPARSYHPAWHQLGEVTKSVWRERAQAQLLSEFA